LVAAALGVVGDGDLWPRQGGELLVEGGLVGLHEQQVGGVLDADQPVGVGVLVWSASAVITAPLNSTPSSSGWNWRIPVGGAVHVGLGEDRAAGVVHHGEQVDLRAGVVAAAAQGLPSTATAPRHAGWGGGAAGRPATREITGGRLRFLLQSASVGDAGRSRACQGGPNGRWE
jgi:hypothetical protein